MAMDFDIQTPLRQRSKYETLVVVEESRDLSLSDLLALPDSNTTSVIRTAQSGRR
jgi:hypothetical protein